MGEQFTPPDHVGQSVTEVPKPAAILDVAKVKRHCNSMLEAARSLGLGFRAHVKTHKLGDSKDDAKLIVSTVAELEHLLPLLNKYVRDGRRISVLYGIPLPPSQVPRLAEIARRLGPESLIFMIDHPCQLGALRLFYKETGFAAGIYVKVDTGYHRAGLPAASLNKGNLIQEISHLEKQNEVFLVGLYSHSSLSYGGHKPVHAFDSLCDEIKGCVEAMHELRKHYNCDRTISISVGASPQAIALQNLVSNRPPADVLDAAKELKGLLDSLSLGHVGGFQVSLEIHAGVYSVMDLQQLAAKSKESFLGYEQEIALTIAAEVVSVYNDHERYQHEALIAVGTLGLGREPCQSYHGWGVISTQNIPSLVGSQRRLVVDRISQEHAILAWERAEGEDPASMPHIPLEVGQTVFVYPNHACVTGAMYKSYLVVDSSRNEHDVRVIDNWKRCSGW
ncbi:hypothetical protein ACHAPJ_004038 [Fusarium lateritium]